MRQAQKLQAIGQLTGGVAHDFNNLLAVIRGNTELLAEGLESKSEDEENLLRSVYHAVERGSELTMRLLAFSRRQALSPMAVDMRELASGMTDLLRRTLGETIGIRMESAPGGWLALADPGQLENAILNLGINARDSMPGGGEITIRTGNESISDELEAAKHDVPVGDYVTVSLQDTGYGMPADIVEKSIEPFFTTKDVGEGTGLGLSMIYGFVKQSAGGMSMVSREGEGTTVTLCLPRAPGTASTCKKIEIRDVPLGSGETILLVEDDAELRLVARHMLEGLGYRVIAAEDARDGMAKLGMADHIDLLLSDVVLPGGLSGPDLADAALMKQADLKVLFMSGYADRVTRNHPLPPGAKLLNKPFKRRELAQLVRNELMAPGF